MDSLMAHSLLDCTQQVLLISAVAQHPETRLSVCVYVSLCDWSAVRVCGDLQDSVLEGLVGLQKGNLPVWL